MFSLDCFFSFPLPIQDTTKHFFSQLSKWGLFVKWETALATMNAKNLNGVTPGEYARAFARIENHYFVNKGFLNKDNIILNNMYQTSTTFKSQRNISDETCLRAVKLIFRVARKRLPA